MTVDVIRADHEPYATILDDFAVVTVTHPVENELGAAAFAARSLLAPRSPDPFRHERITSRLRSLGAGPETSTHRSEPREVRAPTGWSAESSTTLLHEGYLLEPTDEGAREIEKLRADLGGRFWACSPEVWRAWGCKPSFRERCGDILGAHAMPLGVETTATEEAEVVSAVLGFQRKSSGTVIVKLPGSGGDGNRVLRPESADSWPERIRHVWAGRAVEPGRPVDVVVETWLPWTTTYSVSFLVAPDTSPTLVAACEQVLDPATGGFVGSRSHGPLDRADGAAMVAQLVPLLEAMRSDGYVGVAAIDVVVGPGTSWSGRGIELPSGQRMAVIECNPRFNQHNRIGLVVARLGRQWDVPESDLSWTADYLRPAEPGNIEPLLASHDAAIPPPPEAGTSARLRFAHRMDFAIEIDVRRSSRDHDRWS